MINLFVYQTVLTIFKNVKEFEKKRIKIKHNVIKDNEFKLKKETKEQIKVYSGTRTRDAQR